MPRYIKFDICGNGTGDVCRCEDVDPDYISPDNYLITCCRDIIECDTAKISRINGIIFLIIGFNRNTKDDTDGVWIDEDGNEKNWNYVDEKVVASGNTESGLLSSLREYVLLCKMTTAEYLNKLGIE